MSHPPVVLGSVLLAIGLAAVIDRRPAIVALLVVAVVGAVVAAARRQPRVITFPEQVAARMLADGWRQVTLSAAMGPLGTDITGVSGDGRRWVVRCHSHGVLDPADVQRFADAVRQMRRADVHALVTEATLTVRARAAADGCRTVVVDRAGLARGDLRSVRLGSGDGIGHR
jgi:hypothetical protein